MLALFLFIAALLTTIVVVYFIYSKAGYSRMQAIAHSLTIGPVLFLLSIGLYFHVNS